MKQTTLPNFPFDSQFINVQGSKIHYYEKGQGDPILFLHGMPASSYLWRNIVPSLSPYARCIAPDLIGMGQSEKPNISYRVFDHIKYIEGFIEALKLRNVTLVLHGLGSIIGFDYAKRHPENIKALSFYEPYIGELKDRKKLSLPIQHLASLFQSNNENYKSLIKDDKLIDKIFSTASLRKLTPQELEVYRAPFVNQQDRKIIWQYIQDSPFGNRAPDVAQLISEYTEYMQHSSIPKLLLYAVPGFLMTIENVGWCRKYLKHLTIADLGEGLHFVQEYNPKEFAEKLTAWYLKDVKNRTKEEK